MLHLINFTRRSRGNAIQIVILTLKSLANHVANTFEHLTYLICSGQFKFPIWILMQRWKHAFYDETTKKNRFSRHSMERKKGSCPCDLRSHPSFYGIHFVYYTATIDDLSWFIVNFFIREAWSKTRSLLDRDFTLFDRSNTFHRN